MKQLLFGKDVYFRYDPDDLSEVRIYDLEDRFITTAPADNRELRYGTATEEVKQAMRDIRQAERVVKEALKAQVLAASDRPTALELRLNEARHNRQENGIPPAAPKVINIQRVEEQPLLRKVAGGIDLDRMNQNSSKRQEGRK